MCLWEVILHIRGSNNPGAAVDQAIDSVYARHGTCEMRSVMNELSEACDREYHEVMAAEVFDGSFDWEWCHNWLRTRVNWDPTGDDLPQLIEANRFIAANSWSARSAERREGKECVS